jgi:thymidylate synthase
MSKQLTENTSKSPYLGGGDVVDGGNLVTSKVKKDELEGGNFTHPEYQYLNLLQDILDNGSDKEIFLTPEVKAQYLEKGEELPFIRSVFGRMMRFDLRQGFPLLTTKKVFLKAIIIELLWLLKGSGNIKFLIDNNVHIWDEWGWKKYVELKKIEGETTFLNLADYLEKVKTEPDFALKYADLGPAYPVNWRHFKGEGDRKADQIAWVIEGLKKRPFRKSYVVSAWHPVYTYEMARTGESMALPPCHTTFQFNVNDQNELSLALFQRSADTFLGVPFNIASYALLTMMVAQVCDLKVGEFVHFLGDTHLYSNHFEQAKEQIARIPQNLPTMKLNPAIKNIDDFKYEDFILENYNPLPALKGEITNVGGY